MLDHYKLRSRVSGFVSLPSGGTMGVTIPPGSIVSILCAPLDATELMGVRYGDRSCTVRLQDLQKCGTLCGTPVESSRVLKTA